MALSLDGGAPVRGQVATSLSRLNLAPAASLGHAPALPHLPGLQGCVRGLVVSRYIYTVNIYVSTYLYIYVIYISTQDPHQPPVPGGPPGDLAARPRQLRGPPLLRPPLQPRGRVCVSVASVQT